MARSLDVSQPAVKKYMGIVEIKAFSSTPRNQLRTLEAFVDANGCPFGIIINNGDEIFMLSEKIIQVSAIYL